MFYNPDFCLHQINNVKTIRKKNTYKQWWSDVDENRLVDCDVSDITGPMYSKNMLVNGEEKSKWFIHGNHGYFEEYENTQLLIVEQSKQDKGAYNSESIENMTYVVNKSIPWLGTDKNISYIWLSGDKLISPNNTFYIPHFRYKSNTWRQNSGLKVQEGSVSHFRDKTFVSATEDLITWNKIEKYWAEDRKMPPKTLTKILGIEASNVNHVSFDMRSMYITMQSGDVYKYTPSGTYTGEVVMSEKEKLTCKDVEKYEADYVLYKNGDAEIRYLDKVYKMKNVKQVIPSLNAYIVPDKSKVGYKIDVSKYVFDNMFFALTNDGKLYGWGDNYINAISNDEEDYVSFSKKVLIAEDVVEISAPDLESNCVYYLKEDGKLFIKGEDAAYPPKREYVQ